MPFFENVAAPIYFPSLAFQKIQIGYQRMDEDGFFFALPLPNQRPRWEFSSANKPDVGLEAETLTMPVRAAPFS